jgi:hypothetical protein
VNSLFATDTQRNRDVPPRPGPDARLVGRPRVTALVIWAYIGLIGAAIVAQGSTGAVIFGALFLALFLFGAATTLRSRVWVDGPVLYYRRLLGFRPPLRLDRLRVASLSAFGRNSGRQLRLVDREGTDLVVDATNLRLVRLYAALAPFIDADDPVANELLHKRMAKHRPAPPLGPF